MGAFPGALLASILLCLIGTTASAPIQLETMYPIQFTEVTSKTYVYTNVLTQTYEEPYILDENELRGLIDDAFGGPSLCTSDKLTGCEDVTRFIQTLQQNTKELVLREIQSTFLELKNNVRSKRGLGHWSGTVMKSWTDVALLDDLEPLMKEDTAMNGKIKALHIGFQNLEKLNMNISSILRELVNQDLLKNMIRGDQKMMRDVLRSQLTHLLFHYNNIQDACNRRVIAIESVDMFILHRDLELIQSTLAPSGLALSIPLSNIEDYYKLRICTCQFVNNAVRMSIHLPIKRRHAAYKLYTPTYLPFKFENQICSIQAHNAILLHDTFNGDIHVSSAQYLKDCDLSTHLCKLYRNYNPSTDAICLQETFAKRPVEEVRQLCPFVCRTLQANGPMINYLGPNKYAITNIPNNTYVMSSTGVHDPLPSDQNGAFILTLPCTSKLVQYVVGTDGKFNSSRTLIDKIPCSNESNFGSRGRVLKPVIPLQWLSDVSFARVALNDEWKNVIPHYSFASMADVQPGRTPLNLRENGERGWLCNFFGIPDFMVEILYVGSNMFFVGVFPVLFLRILGLNRKIIRLETLLLMQQQEYTSSPIYCEEKLSHAAAARTLA